MSGGWKRGGQTISTQASDASGIRENRIYVDGDLAGRIAHACEPTKVVPCPNGGDAFTLETSTIKRDGPHSIAIEAIDSAGNAQRDVHTVSLDNSPPSQPEHLMVAGGDGWRSANAFDVSWGNPAADDGSPIAGAEWELCSKDGTTCDHGSATGANLTSLTGLKAPSAGEWTLRVWLRDDAGNADPKTAAAPVTLRFDDEVPQASFANPDPGAPTRVAVDVTDNVSGLGSGSIELQTPADGAWHPLDTRVEAGRLVTDLDDEHLADGVYQLRARAVDRAGNERTTDTKADGTKEAVTMPVRLKTRLVAGVLRHVRGRHGKVHGVLRPRARVPYGGRVRMRGRLLTSDGTPFPDAPVAVLQQLRQPGATPTPVASLKTTRSGRFSYLAPKGASRSVLFRYAGTSTIRAVTRPVQLGVPGSTTIHGGRRTFVNGETMRFRGRLRGGGIPPAGKLVELQVRLRGHYRTFATTRSGRTGRWSYGYRFDGTRGRQVYRFRARVPREANYPYLTGVSRHLRVIVRGL